jgi:hypothetical protein
MPRSPVAIVDGSSEATRHAYVAACVRHVHETNAGAVEDIGTLDRRLARLGAEMRAVSRQRAIAQRRAVAAARDHGDPEPRFASDYEALIALPGVASVAVEAGRISVTTTPVAIMHEGESYLIGSFAILVDFEHGVRISNIANTSQRTGWDHPHVQGTAPCLGNLQEGCEILLGQVELVPLVSLLIQFLDTYQPETAYAPITLWRRLPS